MTYVNSLGDVPPAAALGTEHRPDPRGRFGRRWPGVPLLRQMLLELGQRLVHSAVIAEPADVFWLRPADPRGRRRRHRHDRASELYLGAGPGGMMGA